MVHQSGLTVLLQVQPRIPFNQVATYSPPLAIGTTIMRPSTTLEATATIGRLQPTAQTTGVTSTSTLVAGTGTTTTALTVTLFGRWPKHLQADEGLPFSFFASMLITNEQIREDLYQGYFDARKNKRNTLAQLNFEIFMEHELENLYFSLVKRTYKPLPAFCFITFDPVQREVFASQFRDRVIHHMLYNYLAPLFETLFIYDTYSCRLGMGTLFGVERYQHHLRSVTNNFTEEAHVLYIDLSGYFMSIDKKLLMNTILKEVWKHLDRKSPDGRLWEERIDPIWIEYLLHCVLDHEPAKDCIRVGAPTNWNGLPHNKSLQYSPEGYGIVIGDITSQLFSNIVLNIYDQFVKRTLKIKHYGHYVDDMYHMDKSRSFLLEKIPQIQEFLQNDVHVHVHPNKIRLLSAYDANQYLGAYVRPYYIVPRQRTINKFSKVMNQLEYRLVVGDPPTIDELYHIRAQINSYCGLLIHYKSFNLRRKYLDRPAFYKYFIFDKGFSKVILRPEYGGKIPIDNWYLNRDIPAEVPTSYL